MGQTMSYDEYITLLLSAASAYDAQFKPTKAKRHVMIHELQDNHDEDIYHNEDTFDIDCPVSSIQAYATNFRPRNNPRTTNPRTTPPRYACHLTNGLVLDEASRSIWDQLDEKAKSIILGYTHSQTTSASVFNSHSLLLAAHLQQ